MYRNKYNIGIYKILYLSVYVYPIIKLFIFIVIFIFEFEVFEMMVACVIF